MPDTLKPCPFCGGEVSMSLMGQGVINWLFITRGNSKTKKNCSCRLFMESDRYFIDTADYEERREDAREALVDAWNRRVENERRIIMESKENMTNTIDVDKAMAFIEGYAFKDDQEVYTNGSVLVPLFRVKQAIVDKAYNGLFES